MFLIDKERTVTNKYIQMSERAYAGYVEGKIVCLWGVIRPSILSNRGYMWLLTTEEAEEHKFMLLRLSQRIIEDLATQYAVLCGECLVGDHKARKWMTLLGAKFGEVEGKSIPFQIVKRG